MNPFGEFIITPGSSSQASSSKPAPSASATNQPSAGEVPILTVKDPHIKFTWFPDPDAEFRTRFMEHLFVDLERLKARLVKEGRVNVGQATLGGWKVRGRETWDSAEAQLIKKQVCQFVSTTCNQEHVYIKDRWANVMEEGKGWYSSPHSHQTDIAVVYLLDGGGLPQDVPEGRLHIIDPRIPFCCPGRPEHATRSMNPMIPELGVIQFPGHINHWVSPFFGDSPRITLAFNVGLGLAPEGHDESQLDQQVLHPTGGEFI